MTTITTRPIDTAEQTFHECTACSTLSCWPTSEKPLECECGKPVDYANTWNAHIEEVFGTQADGSW